MAYKAAEIGLVDKGAGRGRGSMGTSGKGWVAMGEPTLPAVEPDGHGCKAALLATGCPQ